MMNIYGAPSKSRISEETTSKQFLRTRESKRQNNNLIGKSARSVLTPHPQNESNSNPKFGYRSTQLKNKAGNRSKLHTQEKSKKVSLTNERLSFAAELRTAFTGNNDLTEATFKCNLEESTTKKGDLDVNYKQAQINPADPIANILSDSASASSPQLALSLAPLLQKEFEAHSVSTSEFEDFSFTTTSLDITEAEAPGGSSFCLKEKPTKLVSSSPQTPVSTVVATKGGICLDLSPLFAPSPIRKQKEKQKLTTTFEDNIHQEAKEEFKPEPVLTLGNFQESIWINLGDEKSNVVGKTQSYFFRLVAPIDDNTFNLDPTDNCYHVEVEKVPTKKGFLIQSYENHEGCNNKNETRLSSGGKFVIRVAKGCMVRCCISWTPTESGGVREIIHLKLPRGRMRITVQGSASAQPPKKAAQIVKEQAVVKKSCTTRISSDQVRQNVSQKPTQASHITRMPLSKLPPENRRIVVKSITPLKENIRVLASDSWAESQSKTFTTWINFVLKPTDGIVNDEEIETIHKECLTKGRDFDKNALRTLLLHRAATQTRRRAREIYNCKNLKALRTNLHRAVENQRLSIRSDRDMLFDLGSRDKVLELLFSYSTTWLHLGLEVIFGENISLDPPKFSSEAHANNSLNKASITGFTSSRSRRRLLRDYIVYKLLDDKSIKDRYTFGKCKVPSGDFAKRYHAERKRHTLFHLVMLVILLDKLKASNVLVRAPNLFLVSANIKSSEEFMVTFCREFMSGEGNIIKHLGHLGVNLTYQQSKMDEFDFSVTHLAADMRDGVRLSRMIEILANDSILSLTSKMRIPANSRLQKIHNVEVALNALRNLSVPGMDLISPKHLVDGHRDKVLFLLWSIFAHFQLSSLLDSNALKREIKEITNNRSKCMDDSTVTTSDVIVTLLLDWCRAVGSVYGLDVSNFTTSLEDGKLLCYLVHHYHPGVLPIEEIERKFSEHVLQRRFFDAANNKHNFSLLKAAMCELGGCPPMPSSECLEEKSMIITLSYIFSRLVESRNQVRASVVIQNAIRRYWRSKLSDDKIRSALIIWRYWQRRKDNYRLWVQEKYGLPAQKIIVFFKKYNAKAILVNKSRKEQVERWGCAVKLQSVMRGWLCRLNFWVMNFCATEMQRLWKGYYARAEMDWKLLCSTKIQAASRKYIARAKYLTEQEHRIVLVKSYAAVNIQKIGRGFLARFKTSSLKHACCIIQRFTRRLLRLRDKQVHSRASLLIQRNFRRHRAQTPFFDLKHSSRIERLLIQNIILLQRTIRGHCVRRTLVYQNYFSTVIQRMCRGTIQRHRFWIVIVSTIALQSFVRRVLFEGRYKKYKKSTILLQSIVKSRRSEVKYYAMRRAAFVIQNAWRAYFARDCFNCIRMHVITIQSFTRTVQAVLLRKREVSKAKRVFLQDQRDVSSTLLQRCIRGYLAYSFFIHLKRSSIYIQRIFRGYQTRQKFKSTIKSVIKLQMHTRSALVRWNLYLLNFAANEIQRVWRGNIYREQERLLRKTENFLALKLQLLFKRKKARYNVHDFAATVIQSAWRGYDAKTFFFEVLVSSIMLQCMFRRWIVCKRFIRIRAISVSAVLDIQRVCRGYQARSSLAIGFYAVLQMQCIYRGWKARSALKIYKFEASIRSKLIHKMVVRLQNTFRGFVNRKNSSSQTTSILLLQANFRSCLASKNYNTKFKAVRTIQSAVRLMHQRKKECEICLIESAATDIQRIVRAHRCRVMFMLKQWATLCIQANWRNFCCVRGLKIQRTAAIQVQRTWRIKAASLNYHSASQIQRIVRGHISRIIFDGFLICAISLQSSIRRWLAVQDYIRIKRATINVQRALRRRQTVVKGVCTLQKIFRMSLIEKHHLNRSLDAALTLQRHWRGFICVKNYFNLLVSAIMIQTTFRGFSIRNEFRESKSGAIAIQKIARGFQTWRKKNELLFYTVKIQSCWRANICRKCRTERKLAVNCIQNFSRMVLAKRIYKRLLSAWQIQNKSACIIQKSYRGYCCHIQYMVTIYSAIMVQSIFRGIRAKSILQKQKRAMTKRQSAAGSHHAQVFVNQEWCQTRLSCFVLFLQSRVRKQICRKRFLMLLSSTVKLQAFQRGGQVRKSNSIYVRNAEIRIRKAQMKANQHPHMALGWQTRISLDILQTSIRLCEVFEALKRLELSTRLSHKCRQSFAYADAACILYDHMRRCNRSLPHVELMKLLLAILCNVTECTDLIPKVATENSVDVLIDVVQNFRDKEEIFGRSIWILLQVCNFLESTGNKCLSTENFKRLRGLHAILKRKIYLGTNKIQTIGYLRSNHGHGETWKKQSGVSLLECALTLKTQIHCSK